MFHPSITQEHLQIWSEFSSKIEKSSLELHLRALLCNQRRRRSERNSHRCRSLRYGHATYVDQIFDRLMISVGFPTYIYRSQAQKALVCADVRQRGQRVLLCLTP